MVSDRDNWQLTGFFQGIGAMVLAGGCAIAFGNSALADIKPDATMGAESSLVTSPIPNRFLIEGGATRGTSLFHSFTEFSVPTNGIASFNNTPTIENIISRVTGTSASSIDGVVLANGTANLFLINPNGIAFGPKARLAVKGSFFASTAESVVFENSFAFSATNPQAPPLLTINTPIGLQFGAKPGRIVNQSIFGFQVQPGRTLALVGGDIAIEGGILLATDGRIELGSVAGNNLVNLAPTDTGYALSYGNVEDFQDISLTQAASVVTRSKRSGSIQVQGRNVTLTDGSQIGVLTSGSGGSVRVNASGLVQLIGSTPDGRFASGIVAQTQGAGKAGDVSLTAGQLLISDGAGIATRTSRGGEGGSVIVEVSDWVKLIGTTPNGMSSGIATQTFGQKKAGDVRLTAGQLLISDGAGISTKTFGEGEGGSVSVDVSDSVQLIGTTSNSQSPSGIFATTEGAGKGGDVRLTAGQLLVQDGAGVTARTFGEGEGGNLIVEVSDSVQLIGTAPNGQFGSGLFARTEGTGKAGELRLSAGQLLIADGAVIAGGTAGEGEGGSVIVEVPGAVQLIGTTSNGAFTGIATETLGARKAGDVRLTAGQLLVRDAAGISASTLGEGEGGSVIVDVSGWVKLIGTTPNGLSSGIATQTFGSGNAGEVKLTAGQLLVRDGAAISASTFGEGEGGRVMVDVSDWVRLIGTTSDGLGSGIATQTLGLGKAGEVRLTARQLLISDGAAISASTLGEREGGSVTVDVSDWVQLSGGDIAVAAFAGGTAGNLTLKTRQLSVQDGSQITVSSPFGQAGNLTITAESLLLNQGSITAVTAVPAVPGVPGTSGIEGGANITLKDLGLLRMDNESLISANALEDANGGNVTIDATLIVATPPTGAKGSDITANANRGNGGQVNITTQGLFGIEFRDELTPFNDITASSEEGFDGEVIINQPNVDPRQGLAALPANVVDAEGLIDRRCTSTGSGRESSFVVTGRGGLPPSPNEVLQGESVITNWITLDAEGENSSDVTPQTDLTPSTPKQLVEAQSWVYGANGEVILIAQAPTAIPHNSWSTSPSCDAVGRGREVFFNAEGRGG